MQNTSKMATITILAPHIDDEVIGAGGSIAKHISLGNVVNVFYFNSGVYEEEIRIREAEAKQVCDFLGMEEPFFLRVDINNMTESTLKSVVAFLRAHNTDFLYAPHEGECDSHHVAVSRVAARALWMANFYYPDIPGRCDIKGLFLYEVHSPISMVNYYEDISAFQKVKEQALGMYRSQIQRVRYDIGTLCLNRYRGITSELGDAVEAFQVRGLRDIFEFGGK